MTSIWTWAIGIVPCANRDEWRTIKFYFVVMYKNNLTWKFPFSRWGWIWSDKVCTAVKPVSRGHLSSRGIALQSWQILKSSRRAHMQVGLTYDIWWLEFPIPSRKQGLELALCPHKQRKVWKKDLWQKPSWSVDGLSGKFVQDQLVL